MKINQKVLESLYSKMVTIRFFEEAILELYQRNLVRGAAHLYIGEEGIAAGVCEALSKNDYILTTHRGHGHCLAKGADPRLMMAELLGKETGYCEGKGGSMHISDYAHGILCANGIVGGSMPISVGSGLAVKLRNEKAIVVSFFGDGAFGQGSFHESMNLAAVWKLPILFVCENNQYAISTHCSKSIAPSDIGSFAQGYGISGATIDGNNVLEVFETAQKFRDQILNQEGPVFIEAKTFRLHGHYVGDNENYRKKEDTMEQWKNEPIAVFEKLIKEEYPLLEEKFNQTKKNLKKEMESAVEFALNSPVPSTKDIFKGMFNPGPAWERRSICEKDYSSASNQ